METLLTNHEVEFEIYFDYFPTEPRLYDHPGSPEEIDIISISIYEKELSPVQMQMFIEDYGLDLLTQACLDYIQNKKEDY